MSDLGYLQNRVKGGTVAFRQDSTGKDVATLGLNTSGNKASNIVPIEIRFDAGGNAISAMIPRQNRSGGNEINLRKAPLVKEALLDCSGRGGADFLAGVGKALGGRFETNHFDASQSLGASNPDAAARTNLHAQVAELIVTTAQREQARAR